MFSKYFLNQGLLSNDIMPFTCLDALFLKLHSKINSLSLVILFSLFE